MVAQAAASPVRARTILDLADAAQGETPIVRALRVVAPTGEDAARLREAPLGRLHAAALGFHAALAGPRLEAVASCPSCACVVEFALDVASLQEVGDEECRGELTMPTAAGDWHARWRAPTPADLMAVAGREEAASALLEMCCDARGPEGEGIADAPAELVEQIEAALAEADPLAEVTVAVECPDCGALFEADVDPLAFVWREVQARAGRVLRDVDALARAYGWTEAEVLALSEERRSAYLEIVREGA